MLSRGGRQETAEDAALRLVQEHAADLLRFARRFSHCADDAHDAYQRTLEILVRRLRTEPPTHPLAWVRTVLRNEALALRREREQLVDRVEVDLDRHEGRHLEDPVERAVGHERLRHTAEALQRLKPQEVTALVLRAEGLSYREICTRTGWTYTRTNRTVTEGRRALLERLGAIETGAECVRWLPLLSALADGEAAGAELAELRPHLRACAGCRATLRDFRAAPAQVAALVPPALVPLAGAADGPLPGHLEAALHALVERTTLLAARVQSAFEAVPGAKLAAVASLDRGARGRRCGDRAGGARPARAGCGVAHVRLGAGRECAPHDDRRTAAVRSRHRRAPDPPLHGDSQRVRAVADGTVGVLAARSGER
jgi:RNA polymerase sigma factor (sigma-70 family)